MLTAILILQCLIIIILFALYGQNSTYLQKTFSNNNNTKELEIFRSGLKQTWMYVNVSLFKMWNELDILDYDSLQSKLQQTLDDLSQNPKKMEEWSQKFNEYMKNQENLGD